MNSTTASSALREALRHRLLLLAAEETPHDPRDDDEQQRGHEPEHENVLGDGEIDAEDLREMNQRVIEAAVRDVAEMMVSPALNASVAGSGGRASAPCSTWCGCSIVRYSPVTQRIGYG